MLGTFALMNVAPIAAAVATGHWVRASDNCPIDPRKVGGGRNGFRPRDWSDRAAVRVSVGCMVAVD